MRVLPSRSVSLFWLKGRNYRHAKEKKKMRQVKVLVLLSIMVMVFSFTAQAAKPDAHPGKGALMKTELTPEEQKQIMELVTEHRAKIMPLRDKLDAKRMELGVYAGSDNINREEVRALIAEIVSLRGEIRAERAAFFDTLVKKGLTSPTGPFGMRKGMMGQYCFGPDGDDGDYPGGWGHGMGQGYRGLGMGCPWSK